MRTRAPPNNCIAIGMINRTVKGDTAHDPATGSSSTTTSTFNIRALELISTV